MLEVYGSQTPVLAMGNFNDEPFDTSLARHTLSTRQWAKITSAREKPLLWNLLLPIAGLPDGSSYFDNQLNMLDQFLVNKNMATSDAAIKANPGTGAKSQNRQARSISVSTRSRSDSAEWASRSIKTDSPTTTQSQ